MDNVWDWLQTMEEERVSSDSTFNEFDHHPNHVLPCWLHMIRVVIVDEDSDILRVVMVGL